MPIIDLHCDLLLYLARVPGATIHDPDGMGATLPHLRNGNVKWQVMAIFTKTEEGSTDWGKKQLAAFDDMLASGHFRAITQASDFTAEMGQEATGCTLAIENMSAFSEEDEPLQDVFDRLDDLLLRYGKLFYITITHNTENRFGGGNYSEVGLKPDGEALLAYMAEKNIPLDFSHTSDAFAFDMLTYMDKHNLNIPVLASHSNFRSLCDHPRNLPDELVQELIGRGGVIGANFLRLFVHPDDPDYLLKHIAHGLALAPDHMAFGADFFWTGGIRDKERQPLFFDRYDNAGVYSAILQSLSERGQSDVQLEGLAYQNVQRFVQQNW